jgi:hypothetical protein
MYYIRTFESGADVYQVRVGKLGEDLIILYSVTSNNVDKNYGDLPKGSPTNYIIASWDSANNNFTAKKYNATNLGKGRMPTNEALKNFKDSRLIWASIDENNYLIINRLGTLTDYNDNLNDDDEEVFNDIINNFSSSGNNNGNGNDNSKDNGGNGNNNINDDSSSDSNNKKKKSMLILIIILVLLVVIGIVIAVVCIYRDRHKEKKTDKVKEETNIENDSKKDNKKENKNEHKKREDDEKTSNLDNDPHASTANLQPNNVKIYSSLEKK